jgi:hypothetical protein
VTLKNETSGAILKNTYHACNIKLYHENFSTDLDDATCVEQQQQQQENRQDIRVKLWRFYPVSAKWQNEQYLKFRLKLEYEHQWKNIGSYFSTNVAPKTFINVIGNGNCFFRALSFIISGLEIHHLAVRNHIVQYMATARIGQQLQDMYGKHDPNTMINNAVWATNCEILACAAYMGTDIIIYSATGWLTYEATFLGDKVYKNKLYLRHLNDHFDIVSSV